MLSKSQNDEAASLLGKVRECQSLSPLETFELGWLFGRSGHFAIALETFDKVPENVPDRSTHTYAVALSRFELSEYQSVIKILESARSDGITDAKAANLLAVSYTKLGLYKNAYAILLAESQRDPNDLTTYLNLATVCAEGGDYTKSAEVASQATQRFPQAPEAFIYSGAANSLAGHLDRAYENFTEASRLAPDRADARFLLALTRYQQGRFSEALSALQAASRDGIVDSDLNYLAAECLLKIDPANTESVLTALNRAIELNAHAVSARTLRGKLLLEEGHSKEGLADLEFAAHSDPDSRSALYNLARAYRTLGRAAEAQALFAKLRGSNADGVTELGDRRLNEALHNKESQ